MILYLLTCLSNFLIYNSYTSPSRPCTYPCLYIDQGDTLSFGAETTLDFGRQWRNLLCLKVFGVKIYAAVKELDPYLKVNDSIEEEKQD